MLFEALDKSDHSLSIPKWLWIPLLGFAETLFMRLGRWFGRILPERWISLRAALDTEVGEPDINLLLAGGAVAGFFYGIGLMLYDLIRISVLTHQMDWRISPLSVIGFLGLFMIMGMVAAIASAMFKALLVMAKGLIKDFALGLEGALAELARGKKKNPQ